MFVAQIKFSNNGKADQERFVEESYWLLGAWYQSRKRFVEGGPKVMQGSSGETESEGLLLSPQVPRPFIGRRAETSLSSVSPEVDPARDVAQSVSIPL